MMSSESIEFSVSSELDLGKKLCIIAAIITFILNCYSYISVKSIICIVCVSVLLVSFLSGMFLNHYGMPFCQATLFIFLMSFTYTVPYYLIPFILMHSIKQLIDNYPICNLFI